MVKLYLAGCGEVTFCQKDSCRKGFCWRTFCCANCGFGSCRWSSAVCRWAPSARNCRPRRCCWGWTCSSTTRCCFPVGHRRFRAGYPSRPWNSGWNRSEPRSRTGRDCRRWDHRPDVGWSSSRRWRRLSTRSRKGWPASAGKKSSLGSGRRVASRPSGCWPKLWPRLKAGLWMGGGGRKWIQE